MLQGMLQDEKGITFFRNEFQAHGAQVNLTQCCQLAFLDIPIL